MSKGRFGERRHNMAQSKRLGERASELGGAGRLWSARGFGIVVAAALLAGCGSLPVEPATDVDAVRTKVSDELYYGAPTTVFATEYPVESAEDARRRAAAAMQAGNTDLALYMYVKAVELDPMDAESMYRIGVLHDRRGNSTLAARAYARAVEANPEHARALQGLGLAYLETRDLEYAESLLQRAVAIDPGLWRAHSTLGVIADMRADYSIAGAHYAQALALQPQNATVLNNQGYSAYLAGRLDEAEAAFLDALAVDAQNTQARHNLGLVYARQRKYGFAMNVLREVMAPHVAANDIGYIAMLDGDYDAAELLFAEALRLSPRHYEMAAKNAEELRRRRAAALTAAASKPE